MIKNSSECCSPEQHIKGKTSRVITDGSGFPFRVFFDSDHRCLWNGKSKKHRQLQHPESGPAEARSFVETNFDISYGDYFDNFGGKNQTKCFLAGVFKYFMSFIINCLNLIYEN